MHCRTTITGARSRAWGEKVTAASDIKAAFKRGIQATRDGNPYLIEVMVALTGGGAESTWHQGYKLAPERKRLV